MSGAIPARAERLEIAGLALVCQRCETVEPNLAAVRCGACGAALQVPGEGNEPEVPALDCVECGGQRPIPGTSECEFCGAPMVDYAAGIGGAA